MTQILHSGRALAANLVAFDIRWDGGPTGREQQPVLWSMFVTSPDGEQTVQLGYEVVGGAFSAQFVTDRATGRRQDVEEDADLRDGEITVRFPARMVGVAANWPTWRAVVTVSGSDVAEDVTTT
ncbi:MAG: hypothetical protein M3211_04685 [Actinomycetota bacterium]|nr:hypothetical protein [Actinomycetota bacterium]